MNSPSFRIIATLLFLIVAVTVYSLIVLGNAWGALMVLLGATVGSAMGVSSFSALPKALYITGLVASACFMVFGLKHRSLWLGQAGFVFGVVVWVLLGIFGLGTGT